MTSLRPVHVSCLLACGDRGAQREYQEQPTGCLKLCHGRHSATKPPGKLTTHRTAAVGPMFCGETMGQGVKPWHFVDPGVPGPAPRTRKRTQSRADQQITRVRNPAPTQRPSPTAFEQSPPPRRPTKPACVRPRWRGVRPLAARFDPPWRDRVSRPLAVG